MKFVSQCIPLLLEAIQEIVFFVAVVLWLYCRPQGFGLPLIEDACRTSNLL